MRKKLFVANFEDRVDEEDLERLFSRYGKVVDAISLFLYAPEDQRNYAPCPSH